MSNLQNGFINTRKAVVQPFSLPEFAGKKIHFDILRLDLIHPVISGNKWFKLKYYLEEAVQKQSGTIVTFGGSWSNHIIAAACLANLYSLKSVGIIRGERPAQLSTTLQAAEGFGMTFEFLDRHTYARIAAEGIINNLANKYRNSYVIPEGGAGLPGIAGSTEILSLVESGRYSHIICCIGTGTMYRGLNEVLLPHQQLIGIPVLKGMSFFPADFTPDQQKRASKIVNDYHFGGYAKKTVELIQFINYCYLQTGIPSDFVYTGKLLFACSDLAVKDYFPENSEILVIHSGGLQGNASLPRNTLLF